MEINVENGEMATMPWYSKYIGYLKNRNRISPGTVTIRNSEFITTGPRRKLRVMCPPLLDSIYYLNTNRDRPESVNDNFFSRWTKRPHPSGNCRCSYRRSGRLSTTEEQLISNEIQRIRTSLCEAEKTGQDIEELEQSVYLNIENLRTSPQNPLPNTPPIDEHIAKEKIVKDLEKYINDLLDEILNDTVQILTRMEPSSKAQSNSNNESEKEKLNINFSCYSKNDSMRENEKGNGYVNPGFVGSECDPETLNFHSHNVDCVDSGINSVETIELQGEPQSLEQSLMEIIDSKLGKSPLDKSLEDLNMEIAEYGETQFDHKSEYTIEHAKPYFSNGVDTKIQEKQIINSNSEVEKSRMEFSDEDGATCTRNVTAKMNRTVSALREKLVTSLGSKKVQDNRDKSNSISKSMELNKYPKTEEPKQSVDNSVTLRTKRKPMIVFLHGFGSSADVFGHQLKYFSSLGYPCIAPDMLGHGFSSAPTRSRDYQFDKLLKDIDMILNHYAFKPDQKCIIVGHNYGCSFATSLASKYESQISQLILISGGGPTPLAAPINEGIGHCFLRALLAPFLMCGLHRDILYSARGRQHPYCGPGSQEQWPSHMKYVLKGMVWPCGDYAFHRRICTPTLLIHGLRDNSVSLVQECQMERTMIKALLEAIPTAGHTPMTDCPDQLNHMIHCFIDLWKNKR